MGSDGALPYCSPTIDPIAWAFTTDCLDSYRITGEITIPELPQRERRHRGARWGRPTTLALPPKHEWKNAVNRYRS